MTKGKKEVQIGFVGQGYIGKNYADDFEQRGFRVVRYALEELYRDNKEGIKECEIVFIAVPTPTRKNGSDITLVRSSLGLLTSGATAVIKSTMLPGSTELLQEEFPHTFVLHSPEFLSKKTARHDAAHPERNIVGLPRATAEYAGRARTVLDILPKAPYELVCSSQEAELLKYASNTFGYTKVVFMNLLYDLAAKLGCDWGVLKDAMAADSKIGHWHLDPVHKGGRGAGGQCLPKDFEALRILYAKEVGDAKGEQFFRAIVEKNRELLEASGKDADILKDLYGRSA